MSQSTVVNYKIFFFFIVVKRHNIKFFLTVFKCTISSVKYIYNVEKQISGLFHLVYLKLYTH